MFNTKSWRECVELAPHFIALGETQVYLYDDKDPPWHLTTEVKSGGSYRYNMPVGLEFLGVHECGLTFKWIFKLEEDGSSGRAGYRFDLPRISAMFASVPERFRQPIQDIFLTAAFEVEQQGKENMAYTQQQMGQAAVLRQLASPEAWQDAVLAAETSR